MLRVGTKLRGLSNVVQGVARPQGYTSKSPAHFSATKSRITDIQQESGEHQKVIAQQNSKAIKADYCGVGGDGGQIGGSDGFSNFGGASATVDRFNPIYDDLSRGTVAEDWIPLDTRRQNRMFRMMYARGVVEGPVVDTVADLAFGDFDITGIRDKIVEDTYWAAKEASGLIDAAPYLVKEHLVIGYVVPQMILDPTKGIWSDLIIHNSDFIAIGYNPRVNQSPKLDLLPDPQLQEWARSTDIRDVVARKGISRKVLDDFSAGRAVPLDPSITAYIARKLFHNDRGTSWYSRNIPFWGLEKSLINATLTGHRRRAGPITQIAVGSETWEPTDEQIDAIVSGYATCEEDSVSSTIGTRHDVVINQVRGALNEMWKWSDEFAFLQEAKLKMFGVSEAIVTGDATLDAAPSLFIERVKALRMLFVREFLMKTFFKQLAILHDFRHRTEAEISHRVRIVREDDADLILPSISFHKNLDTSADEQRLAILDSLEEKGVPVGLVEWNRTAGGGDFHERMRSGVADLQTRLQMSMFNRTKQQVMDLEEEIKAGGVSETELKKKVAILLRETKKLNFNDDDGYQLAAMDEETQDYAQDMADNDAILEDAADTTAAQSNDEPSSTD